MDSSDIITLTNLAGDKYVGVIDYGICCDECGYEIEDNVTGYWRDNVTGIWNDVRYCGICVWDFVKQPKRVTAEQIWRQFRIVDDSTLF